MSNKNSSKNIKNNNLVKHWTEPNGIFVLQIPMNWQYRNPVVQNSKPEYEHIYSFEAYKNSNGCFQISAYLLSEQKINKNFPIQKCNSQISWHPSRMDDDKFNVYLWYAQVDDQFLMAKYIYSKSKGNNLEIEDDLNKIKIALDSLRVVPIKDRQWATNLDKHDAFLGSLVASHDLFELALKSESYIESIILISNQIDAYLRLAIILHTQNLHRPNEIEIKYLYQGDDERGISERDIYKKALSLNILNQDQYDRLDVLYKNRNRVVHRYIISQIKTRDIKEILIDFLKVSEVIRNILASYEEAQFEQGFGIYGKGYTKKDNMGFKENLWVNSMINDKHLIKKLEREI